MIRVPLNTGVVISKRGVIFLGCSIAAGKSYYCVLPDTQTVVTLEAESPLLPALGIVPYTSGTALLFDPLSYVSMTNTVRDTGKALLDCFILNEKRNIQIAKVHVYPSPHNTKML